jgi:hypothetical protein
VTYYRDLGPITMIAGGPAIRAVAWLSPTRPVSRGHVDPPFVARLRDLCALWRESVSALRWGIYMGGHQCEFCSGFSAAGNLGVPAGDLLYVAPEMVFHYVERHGYAPPPDFVAAVLACPLPGTPEYAALVAPFVHDEYTKSLARSLPSEESPAPAWDASHDWVIGAHLTRASRLVLDTGHATPTIDDLATLRSMLPQYRDRPVTHVREAVDAYGRLDLGKMSRFEAGRIERDAQAAGLGVIRTNASRMSYSFLDRTLGTALLVERPGEAESLFVAMVATGVPVQWSVE